MRLPERMASSKYKSRVYIVNPVMVNLTSQAALKLYELGTISAVAKLVMRPIRVTASWV